jgi:hypothetical protein
MSGESSASKIFPTFDESELKRILEEKDSKNTRRATKSAVKIFGSYLKARNIPENFEQLTNEEVDEEILRRSTSRERGTLSLRCGINRHTFVYVSSDKFRYY